MSFKERFKDKNEVVQRDGSNAFAQPKSTTTSVKNSNFDANSRVSRPQIPPIQNPSAQQQPPAQPSYAPSVAYSQSPSYAPQQQQQQPQTGFFMTGGGFPVAPPTYNSYGVHPGAVSQTSQQQLPPIQSPQQLAYEQAQQQAYQQPTLQMAGATSFLARKGFAQQLIASPSNGLESPTSAGRKNRVKPPLPDFHELDIIHHGRRAGQQVERMPVLVDHPVIGEYHEHNLREYRQSQREYAKQKWGGLGPEDNPEKQQAREKFRKILEYGKQVNAVNFAVLDQIMGDEWHDRAIEKKPTHEAQLGLMKRQRAMQYADAVKPPVVSARKRPQASTPQPTTTTDVGKELLSLEEKHRRDQEAIRRIKAQLNMLA